MVGIATFEPYMTEDFEVLSRIIHRRRTIKPAWMNGKIIDDAAITQLLELANWAPMHGRTEPWRFFVFAGAAKTAFAQIHAQMYKDHTPNAEFIEKKYLALISNANRASHIIMVAMKRGTNPHIPAEEEYAATAAAIENILLGATTLDIAAMWNTGGMTHYPPMKAYLGLGAEDALLATLYLGYSEEAIKEVPRKIPMYEKVKWME